MGIPAIGAYPMPGQHELPVNIASWKVDPDRAVLLIHDMQKYFVEPFPSGHDPAAALVENLTALLSACRGAGVPVVYTAQPGAMTGDQRGLLRDFWGPGMRASPEHQRVIDELAPDQTSAVFTKWRYSAFHGTGLLEHLAALERDQLIVGGVYAHVGCLMTAVDAFSHDIETFLVADAVADFTAEEHRMALAYAASACSVVLPSAALITDLREHAGIDQEAFTVPG